MEFFVIDPPPVDPRTALIRQIDADVDAIYKAVQGERAAEYALAEQEALAYAASVSAFVNAELGEAYATATLEEIAALGATYTGDVPSSVASWATAKGESALWATNSILTTAGQWRYAQKQIRQYRLGCKELAKAGDVAAVAAQWAGFKANIRSALGIV